MPALSSRVAVSRPKPLRREAQTVVRVSESVSAESATDRQQPAAREQVVGSPRSASDDSHLARVEDARSAHNDQRGRETAVQHEPAARGQIGLP
jgi:hypothetical protein